MLITFIILYIMSHNSFFCMCFGPSAQRSWWNCDIISSTVVCTQLAYQDQVINPECASKYDGGAEDTCRLYLSLVKGNTPPQMDIGNNDAKVHHYDPMYPFRWKYLNISSGRNPRKHGMVLQSPKGAVANIYRPVVCSVTAEYRLIDTCCSV